MNPIAFEIGSLSIRWYGILLASAFLVGWFILRYLAQEKSIEKDIVDNYLIYMIIGLLAGARLGEVFFYEPAYYLADPLKILYVWQGGLASHGAIIGGLLANWLFTRKYKLNFYTLLDLAVIPIALGSAFVRVGNFINGEIVGRVTNLPWGVVFENYDNQLRHPSQFYEAFKNVFIFGVLWKLRTIPVIMKTKVPPGFMSWSFVALFSVLRFFVEFFKEFQTLNVNQVLTMGQYLSIGYFIVSLAMLIYLYNRSWFEGEVRE
jgi:phosphatidylglycerol---prolipoprotein diacylglyceryl transferase